MMTETQFDLFGGEPLVRRSKARFGSNEKTTQLSLFSGLDCLPDQMNLFADDGVPDELVAVATEEPVLQPKNLEVTLDVSKVEDSDQKRVIEFVIRSKSTGEELYRTQSKEIRKGCRNWSQADLYVARRKVRDWCARNEATIVDK